MYYPQYIGATYGGSIFVALASLLHHAENIQFGDRVGIFSYGSGSCAEFYSGLVGPSVYEYAQSKSLNESLDQRYQLSIDEYEILEKQRLDQIKGHNFKPDLQSFPTCYKQHYQGKHLLILDEIKDYYRHYKWS